MPEIDWTVVSGDGYDDPPDGVAVEVIPIRREFALSDCRRRSSGCGATCAASASTSCRPTPRRPRSSALPAARLAGTPAIYTIHGALYFEDNGRKANILGWCFERWCCQWANRVLVQSREDEVALPRVRNLPAWQAGLRGQRDRDGPVSGAGGAALHADRPIVMMVSRLVREKGCADFLALAARCRAGPTSSTSGPFEHDQTRRPHRGGGGRGLGGRARSGSSARSTTCGPTWPRPTWWSSPPTARASPGWPWRLRPWAGRWPPTTSAACARSSTRASACSCPAGDRPALTAVVDAPGRRSRPLLRARCPVPRLGGGPLLGGAGRRAAPVHLRQPMVRSRRRDRRRVPDRRRRGLVRRHGRPGRGVPAPAGRPQRPRRPGRPAGLGRRGSPR